METAAKSKSSAGVAEAARESGHFLTQFRKLRAEIGKVIVGQDDIVEGVLTCLLADGHVLLEGVPGLGKTILVRTLAKVVQVDFGRIQFTPDLMPADIIGTNLIVEDSRGKKHFEFQKGPLFTNVLLADEVNRATPKTQSALLQAMAEQRVTVGTNTYVLDDPYFVLATQNPLEMEGTYPLPEAQLDRFMFKLNVAFPTLDELNTIMDRTITGDAPEASAVLGREEILEMRAISRKVPIAPHVQLFALKVLKRSHPDSENAPDSVHRYVKAGGSPRGGQAMLAAARIRALVRGETAVGFDDVESVALPALRHRLLLNFEGEANEISTDDIIRDILETTAKT
jgi:MoxR-like ATPase